MRGCIDKWDSGFYTATPWGGPRSGAARRALGFFFADRRGIGYRLA
jgi:hypothetical protein